MVVEGTVRLAFGTASGSTPIANLSAVHGDEGWLWLAGDELPRLDRLTRVEQDGHAYTRHASYPLGELVELPDGADEEVDVEGMDRHGDYLWLVGSHSRSRKRPDPDDPDARSVKDLAKIRNHPNRHVILRVPLETTSEGPVPARSVRTSAGEVLTAAILDGDLTEALADDDHLSPFLHVPGKDNGFDVEGLAAFGDRILLGLRGPVLRGWAVLLEVAVEEDGDDPTRLRLGSPPYRKCFVDLNGLGVRDLCRMGDDVLILAGPTMDLDGPTRVYRWRYSARLREAEVVRGREIVRLVDVPFGAGEDHAEGITLQVGPRGRASLLVVYDTPAESRLPEPGTVTADLLGLAPATRQAEPGMAG
jgi:hypothetical protein